MTLRVSIILLVPHTHAGKLLAAGDTITVTERDAVWLIRAGKARQAAGARGVHINTPNNPADRESPAAGEPVAGAEPATPDTEDSTGDNDHE